MQKIPKKLEKSLNKRKEANALRSLPPPVQFEDFSSNDYLGLSTSIQIFEEANRILKEKNLLKNGATGSRLLTGNSELYAELEQEIARFFSSGSAVVYNSGYDANVGFFSCVPQRDDIILYDELVHASIRDGIMLGKAKSYKFSHNNISDLEERIGRLRKDNFPGEIYVVTEGVFSMDGDMPEIHSLVEISRSHKVLLIIDEAHSAGVIGKTGKGLVEEKALSQAVFARIVTFGKAFGAHGAAILGHDSLKTFLVNFSRSLIYTTALPPHSLATLLATFRSFPEIGKRELTRLHENIRYFQKEIRRNNLEQYFQSSDSPIQTCWIQGNDRVKQVASLLHQEGYEVKPILSPTVPKGEERLRLCIHSRHSFDALKEVLTLLAMALHK